MNTTNKEIFARNLRYQMDKNSIKRGQIVEDLGISYSSLTDWVNGKKYPRIQKIEILAEYFGISKSELIEDFEDIGNDNNRLEAIIVKLRTNTELVEVVDKLTELDKSRLERLIKILDIL